MGEKAAAKKGEEGVTGGRWLALWRVAVLLVLGVIATELVIGNRMLKRIYFGQIVESDLGGIEEGLDNVKKAIDNLPDALEDQLPPRR